MILVIFSVAAIYLLIKLFIKVRYMIKSEKEN